MLAQIGSGAKCLLDNYHWGVGMAVTGRIRDSGPDDLKSFFFSTESSSSHSYFHIFLLIAFLEEAFIRNIIKLQINCIIIKCNNNNAAINNNLWKTLYSICI